MFSNRMENSVDLDLQCLKKDTSRFRRTKHIFGRDGLKQHLLLAAMLYEDYRAYTEKFDVLQATCS